MNDLVVWPSGHFTWTKAPRGERENVFIDRRMKGTISVSVGVTGFFLGHELTPEEARDMARALIDAGAVLDAEIARGTEL